jgi:hypothetical protein
MTPKIFLLILRPPKGTTLRKSASIEALWSRWLFPFVLSGSGRIKKKEGKHIRKLYISRLWGADPTEPTVIIFGTSRDLADVINIIVQNFISIGQGVTVWCDFDYRFFSYV